MSDKIGEIQRSQLITTFGIGSIMDVPDYSVVIAGQDFWKIDKLELIREERLEKKLRVKWFRQPSVPKDEFEACIPGFRFPEWVFCPKCHRLAPFKKFGDINIKKCLRCSKPKSPQRLVPARFVVSCTNGHLDDFPWSWWVHRGKDCSNPNLKINATGRSTSLGNIFVKCEANGCGANRSLAGIFSKKSLKGFGGCPGRRPWLGLDNRETCSEDPRVLQRGSASVYFPVVDSAISIPPYSERIHAFLRDYDEALEFLPDSALSQYLKSILDKTGAAFDLVILESAARARKANTEEESETDLRPQEYQALCNPGPKDDRSEFCAEPESVPAKYRDLVSKVVLVHRLREVRALKGFNRIDPGSTFFSPISKSAKNWLPAAEIRGEGIFVELDKNALAEWVRKGGDLLNKQVGLLENKRKTLFADGGWAIESEITPKFLLVHTLAHLLILQLTLDCGYSSSALRERIYVADSGKGHTEMSGFLIYTATADSEGSLGGLVRQGKGTRFGEVLDCAIDMARWCSNDPLCMESKGQGLNSLNLAACHSCALLPETACELRNCYLDRTVVTGTPDHPEVGFFG
jgi:hypothetical protein